MPDEFEAAVTAAVRDDSVKVVVLRGAGRSFCAGYDFGAGFHHWDEAITTEGRWDPGKDFVFATAPAISPTQKFMSMWRAPKPVIAQVHGWCLGGGSETALCADIVIASEDARIGTPYSRMWGCHLSGMWIYCLGLAKAKEYALTGKPLSGTEADCIGLINRAVPFEQLEAEVARTARQLAAIPASQLAAMKLVVNQAYDKHGPGRHPDTGADPRRPDAQHTRRPALHRAGRTRRRQRHGQRTGPALRRLPPGPAGGPARPQKRHLPPTDCLAATSPPRANLETR